MPVYIKYRQAWNHPPKVDHYATPFSKLPTQAQDAVPFRRHILS